METHFYKNGYTVILNYVFKNETLYTYSLNYSLKFNKFEEDTK